MRGQSGDQGDFLSVINIEERIPATHPLRGIKRRLEQVFAKMESDFDAMYSKRGRPSIPPEQLMKARILMALYSVRSDRLFCDQLAYNLLWLWFLDRSPEEGGFDHSVMSLNHDRVFSNEVAELFFNEVYELSREEGWASDDHFSADGTLIEAWGSLKSFQPKDSGEDDGQGPGDSSGFKPSNPKVDFHGQKRGNQTHRSRTDPEAFLYRKGRGKEAKLCFGAFAMMENRNGLLAAFDVHAPAGPESKTEPAVALAQLDRLQETGQASPKTLGADRGYHTRALVERCREQGIKPHVATVKGRRTAGLDRRTTGCAAYRVSQRIRMRSEEIFGWLKSSAGMRKSRHRGRDKLQSAMHFAGAAYNLVRLSKLELSKYALP